ncbi:MAG: Betaine-aldehyde dehydrogenase, partial [Frankiales bacterium]|nr:Betaine-aldehyde dehydrogenase [Frankiales bacterium]
PLPFSGIVRREPIGVVAAITPWNIPLLTLVWKVGPALAAGCSVVIKPDEHAPLVAMELVKEFEAAGLPKGVLNALVGDGEPVGAYQSGPPDVTKVAFTGSTEVGKAILRQSADTVKRVTLELGGKGPNIVLEDADLSVAVDGAIYAAFAYNGEACEAGTRLFVQSSIADEFIKRLTERASTLTVGDPLNPASDVGPVITKEAEERILGFIEGAKKQGATAVVGGGRPQGPEFEKGNWVQPTVFTGVTNDMDIARCEVFGPVLSVLTFDSVDEVIKLANDTDYGLSAGVWSQDEEKAIEVGRQLEAGMVYINDWHVINPNYPFGGFKQSGIGREGGPHSIDEYTESKFISIDRAGAIGNRPFALVIGTPPPGDAGAVAHELADETLAQTQQ